MAKKNTASLSTQLKKEVAEKVDRAYTKVGYRIWHDAVHLPPKPAIETGNLRGSAYAITRKGVIAQGNHVDKTPLLSKTFKDNVGLFVGFTAPYAYKIHETISDDWVNRYNHLPEEKRKKKIRINKNTGKHFLTKKIDLYEQKYINIFKREFKKK